MNIDYTQTVPAIPMLVLKPAEETLAGNSWPCLVGYLCNFIPERYWVELHSSFIIMHFNIWTHATQKQNKRARQSQEAKRDICDQNNRYDFTGIYFHAFICICYKVGYESYYPPIKGVLLALTSWTPEGALQFEISGLAKYFESNVRVFTVMKAAPLLTRLDAEHTSWSRGGYVQSFGLNSAVEISTLFFSWPYSLWGI